MSNSSKFQLEKAQASLVIVDVQERLVPSMPPKVYQGVLASIRFLVESCDLLGVPVTVTEQYPRGLGATVKELAPAAAGQAVEKVSFGCCGEPAFTRRLGGLGRNQVLLVGMEAHVCVYQTVLELLEAGYQVHLVRDAIVSRGKIDYLNALELARAAGAVVTTAETAVFQLLGAASAPEFKSISALVKARSSAGS